MSSLILVSAQVLASADVLTWEVDGSWADISVANNNSINLKVYIVVGLIEY